MFEIIGLSLLTMADSDLQNMFSFLNQHGIGLAIDWGPLTPAANGCGTGIAGFTGSAAQAVVTKIQLNGGVLKYIAMDEPFYFGSIYSGASACQWSASQIATNGLTSLNVFRDAFPGLQIGDIEPVSANSVASAGGLAPGPVPDWVSRYATWFDTFQQVMGAKLAFFDCDSDIGIPQVMTDIQAIRVETSKRSIPFGIIYDGRQQDYSDFEWLSHAQQFFTQFELNNPPPDQAIFQSWVAFPVALLPETTPWTYTWLLDQYARTRDSIAVTATNAQVSGKLTDAAGNAVPASPVDILLKPTTSPGVTSAYTWTGIVASGAVSALAGMRINEECGACAGPADVTIYSIQYQETSGGTQSHTLDFSNGLNGWGLLTTGTSNVQAAAGGTGPGLHVSVSPSQVVQLNSSTFTTTPGATYTLKVVANVDPKSYGAGYFTLIFLPTGSFGGVRQTIALDAGTSELATAQTGSDGSFALPIQPQTNGQFNLIASFAGSNTLWPASASTPLDLSPRIHSGGVVSAATQSGSSPISAGSWISIYGDNLGVAGTWSSATSTVTGGASVSICGLPAVIDYNSGPITVGGQALWQLNALIPDGAAGQQSCAVTVTVSGLTPAPATITIAPGILDLFSFTEVSGQLPVVTHADYSLVGPATSGFKPAQRGETVIAWGTGDCSSPSLTVGGVRVSVAFSGRVEAGLCQTNFAVPSSASGPVVLKTSSASSWTLWVAP